MEFNNIKYKLAYEESIEFIRSLLVGAHGEKIAYVASAIETDNYKRLFARDVFWIGMAALLSGEQDLIDGFRSSLEVLMANQREDGAIASNISPEGQISYGIINPRVDPTTLYIIGCIEYCKYCRDAKVLKRLLASVEKALSYLENVWENKYWSMLYIPRAGNWADEYLQQGFVLYDEVLWHLALKEYAYVLHLYGDKRSGYYREKASKVRDLIREKFWIKNSIEHRDVVYESIREKMSFDYMGYFIHFYYANSKEAAGFVRSHGIFDAFGNTLALLMGITSSKHRKRMLRFIDLISDNKYSLVPAHYPFFREETFRSKKLHQYRFKEYIGHYHNGGLWAWYTGVYVAALVKAGEKERALKVMNGIMKANAEEKDGMNFYEYHTGRKATATVEVVYPGGLDLYFAKMFSSFLRTQMPTVGCKHKRKKFYITDTMSVSKHNIQKGDRISFAVSGPDAEDVMGALVFFKDKQEKRYFKEIKMDSKKSTPDGTPYLGVSAAAYIIAYKAYRDERIIFFDR